MSKYAEINNGRYRPEEINTDDVDALKSPPRRGFPDPSQFTVAFDDPTDTFTITPTGTTFALWCANTFFEKSAESISVPDTDGLHWIYYSTSGVLSTSTATPDLTIGLATVATVYRDATTGRFLLGNEWHTTALTAADHSARHYSLGSLYADGFAATFDNTTFSIGAGKSYDEDLPHTTLVATTSARILYRKASGAWQWTANKQTMPYYAPVSDLQYDDGSGTPQDVAANQYIATWFFATNSTEDPIIAVMGQRTDTTLAAARGNNTFASLALGTMPFKEFVLLYRVIFRNDATPYEDALDFRTSRNVGGAIYTPLTTVQVVEESPNLYVTPDESDALANSTNPLSAANPVADKGYVDAQVNVLPYEVEFQAFSAKIVAGNPLTAVYDAAGNLPGVQFAVYQNASASADEFSHEFICAAGTYSFFARGVKGSDKGKIDWKIDGVDFATGQDWYAAAAAVQTATTTGIVCTAGRHTLTGKINGKNASSSGYNFARSWYRLERTGA